ncbi:MAG: hypothetical protein V3V46_08130 [Anaerolineales bacterium]
MKEQYEKFLSLWKDADPGIAEVEGAKERLAGTLVNIIFMRLGAFEKFPHHKLLLSEGIIRMYVVK